MAEPTTAARMAQLPARENTNFPLAVYKALDALPAEGFLLKHQVLPVRFFSEYPKARGLLLMTETGGGKSIAAAAIADEFIKQGRRPVMIVAKSLQNNMRDNIVKYRMAVEKIDEATAAAGVQKEYMFVSANANNMLGQLGAVMDDSISALTIDDEDEMVVPTNREISLEGRDVIVDEAHHLFNGIVSGSKNARGLYDIIMRTRDIRVLFLTSNVITNSPFEVVPCFNMLAGFELLPVHYDDFMEMFVNEKTGKARGLDHFKARIWGLTSYYGSWYQHGGALGLHAAIVREGFPTRLPIMEVYVPMSEPQYTAYANAANAEMTAKKYSSKKRRAALTKPGKATNYRIASRHISNYWMPDPPVDVATAPLEVHSPKWAAVWANIQKHGDQIGLVFSAWVHTFGIEWFARKLESFGYSQWQPGMESAARRFMFITGDMSTDERSAALAALIAPENARGQIVHLLLGSPAMAEGVNTKRIRHVHILEPSWHFPFIEQIIARAVRLGSHADLPPEEQTVQPYLYLSDYPADMKQRPTEPTVDISLLYRSLKKKVLNDQFYRAMIEASIDCSVHIRGATPEAQKGLKCMMCEPNNRPMFVENVAEDMARPMACKQSVPKDIEVSEVEYAGKTFYYRKEPSGALHVYKFDDATSSYIKLPPSSEYWPHLMAKLA